MSDRNSTCSSVRPSGTLIGPTSAIGHAQIFGLAAGIAAEQMRIAEQPGRANGPTASAALAASGLERSQPEIEAALAEEAFAAGDGEGHDDAVADLELLVLGADLDDLAHGLVAEHVAAFHLRDDAVDRCAGRSRRWRRP